MLPYTSIPILSAAFLIVIGVLIGHLLFYRYRDERSAGSTDTGTGSGGGGSSSGLDLGLDLMAANPDDSLQSQLSEREHELGAIKAAHASLETQWHQLQTEHDQLKGDLTKTKHALGETQAKLSAEQAQRSELESVANDAGLHAERSKQSSAALQTVRDEFQRKLESEEQKTLELGRQIQKRDVELRSAMQKITHLQEQVAASKADSDEYQDSTIATMRKEFDAKLDVQLQEIEELKKAVGERDQLLAKSEETISNLRKDVDGDSAAALHLQQVQAEYSSKLAAAKDLQRAAEAKLASVTATLSESKLESEQLAAAQQDRDEAQAEAKQLKRQLDELLVARREAENDASSAEQQLEKLTAERNEQQDIVKGLQAKVEQLSATLQGERLRNEKLAQAESERSETVGKLQRDSDELLLLRESHQRMQTSIEESQAKLAAMESERAEAVEAATSAQRQIEQLSATVHRQHEELQAHAMQANSWHKQLASTKTRSEEAEAQIAELNSKLEARRQQQSELESVLAEREASVAQLTKEMAEHQNRVSSSNSKQAELESKLAERDAEVQSLTLRVDELQAAHDGAVTVDAEHKHRLASLTQQRDSAIRRADSAESELNELRAGSERNDAALNTIRTQFEEASNRWKEEQTRAAQFEQEATNQSEEIRHLREQIAQSDRHANDHSEISRRLSEATSRLELTTNQRDEAIMAEQSTREIISELRTELTERLEAVEALRRDKDEAVAKMTAERRAKQAMDRQLRQASDQTESELKSLRAQKEVNEQTIRNLRQQRTELLEAQKAKSKQKFMPLSMFKGLSSSVEGFDEPEKTRYDEQLGVLYKKRPARRDDLKMISGIGGVLERKLNKLGVYRYQQVMQWDDVAVEEFSKLLSFRDRIQRDNWIGQARRLYREHYERKVA